MTNTAILERKSNLVMPLHYDELDREEMTYVEGGISTTVVAAIIDVGLLLVVGALNLSLKIASFFGKTYLKRYLKNNAYKWAKNILSFTAVSSYIQASGGNVSSILAMFGDISPIVDQLVSCCSIGGIIANALDFFDGSRDGQISF